jgi:Fe-S oxidoreductase
MISKGLLDQARAAARRNIAALAPWARAGFPIVGLEPSCLLTLRDEYLEFFPDDEDAQQVAGAARLLEEVLAEESELEFQESVGGVYLHNHCHARALAGSEALIELLRKAGADVRESAAGCCGMAGSFGYEREHYELSMQIGGQRLFPEVRQAAEQGAALVAPGTSCRTQIADGTGETAVHPAVYLAERLRIS